MKVRELITDCIDLFCFLFTVGVIVSYFWDDEVRLDRAAFLGGAFVIGRILRYAATGRPVMPPKEAKNG